MSRAQDTPIRVGIAGLGRSGWNIHASAMRPMADKFKIAAVFDPNGDRCREASDEFGCRTYDSFDELLADEDAELIVVASPNRLHPDHSIQALKAGKDVVCEKPMAGTVGEADKMIRAAKQVGKILAIFQNRRYSPDFVKVREVINSGKLGRIVMIRMTAQAFSRRWDWQTLKEFGGGTLNNTGPHFLDQALQLFGDADPEIFCHLERALASGDAEDHAKVILHGPGAPMIDLEITSVCAYPQGNWLVMGTQGGLQGTAGHLEWKYVDFSKMPPRPVDRTPTVDRSYNHEDYDWQVETWDRPADGPSDATCFYTDLYETLRRGKALYITPESVRRQIAVLEKCHKLSPL